MDKATDACSRALSADLTPSQENVAQNSGSADLCINAADITRFLLAWSDDRRVSLVTVIIARRGLSLDGAF